MYPMPANKFKYYLNPIKAGGLNLCIALGGRPTPPPPLEKGLRE